MPGSEPIQGWMGHFQAGQFTCWRSYAMGNMVKSLKSARSTIISESMGQLEM